MKNLISLKKLKKEIEKENNNLLQCYSDIKKEISKKIEMEKKQLLIDISNEYDLDINELQKKFLSKKSKKSKKKSKDSDLKLIDNSSEEDNMKELRERALSVDVDINPLLIKGTANGKDCYYENKEGGSVYDHNVKEIGTLKNGKIYLF